MIPTNQAGLLMNSGEVVSSNGENIGKVGQVYVDNETGALTWVTVKTGWFGSNESFVPLDNATANGSTVTVPYDKDKVKDAPHHAVDAELSVDEEQELYAYYGVNHAGGTADSQYDATRTETVVTDTAATAPAPKTASADGYITRSEEQLRVGTTKVEAGRARLKKYVVTEQQTVTVPVSHEEVTLVREPVTAGEVGNAVIGEDAIEVVLTADQVVVDKQAVAVEKIKLGTQVVTEQQQVTEAVRKEQIEVDTDGVQTTGTAGYTGRTGRTGTVDDNDPSLADKAKGLAAKAKDAIK